MSILAAIDDSKRAEAVLSEASKLAQQFDTSLHAVHVVERSSLIKRLEGDIQERDPADNPEVKAIAEEIVSTRGSGLSVEPIPIVRVGDSAEEIIALAHEEEPHYIVIGGRRRSPTGKALFGSVTQKVLLNATVPVVNVALDD